MPLYKRHNHTQYERQPLRSCLLYTSYGNTKQINEEIIRDTIHAGAPFKSIILRYFNPIGAHPSAEIGELPNGVPQNLIPYLTQTAMGIRKELSVFGDDYDTADGSCIRDYINVVDLAKAHVIAMDRMLENKSDEHIEIFLSLIHIWARLVRDASTIFDNTMTFRDTVIVNPLFMPIVFRGDYLPENLIFYNFDSLKERTPYDNLYRADSIFKDLERNKQFEEMAYKYVQNNYPTYFRYSERDLPNEVIKPKFIKKNIYEDLPIKVEADANFEDVDAPARFIPERRYWISAFESAIQFSQNYVSENWYKGGSSNLNLFTKNNLKYDYKKDCLLYTSRCV